jgi:chromosome condensin MukBEF ATPase and DNA-binding subunit MukB
MPWKPASLEREKHALQMKLLQANAQLRLKTIYAERLEYLLRERLARIDELNGKLEQARTINHRLEQEREHLAGLIAANNAPALLSNVER